MNLNQAQQEAVAHGQGPCLVLAGPGSGKTFTIANRIEYLIRVHRVAPEQILVLTFTRYAAASMRLRFYAVMEGAHPPVTFGTIHGIFYRIVREALPLKPDQVLTGQARRALMEQAMRAVDFKEAAGDEERVKELMQAVSRRKNDPGLSWEQAAPGWKASTCADLYAAYETAKKKAGKIDFEDMIVTCLDLFQTRPALLQRWRDQYPYILVDEFQDVNPIQYAGIRLLAAPKNHLFVVGDDDQSIYGFRGAKPDIMQTFLTEYPTARTILLPVNYRCQAQIVDGSARLISHNQNRLAKALSAAHPAEEPICIRSFATPKEEGAFLIRQMEACHQAGVGYEEMAVLFRVGLDAAELADQLAQTQIPFRMRERTISLYEHFIGRDLMSYLALAVGEGTKADLIRIINRPGRFIHRAAFTDEVETLPDLAARCHGDPRARREIEALMAQLAQLSVMTPFCAIQYIRKRVGYEDFLRTYAAKSRMDGEKWLAILRRWQEEAAPFVTIREFLDQMRERKRMQEERKEQRPSGVSLMTMHSAKGLEYTVVFIAQANEGITPYRKAVFSGDIEEERRLFYVAMTRARRALTITYVREKNGREMAPSRFVEELQVHQ